MDDTELLLNAPELNTVVYEDFSFQEDSLKVKLQVPHLATMNLESKQGICPCAFVDGL